MSDNYKTQPTRVLRPNPGGKIGQNTTIGNKDNGYKGENEKGKPPIPDASDEKDALRKWKDEPPLNPKWNKNEPVPDPTATIPFPPIRRPKDYQPVDSFSENPFLIAGSYLLSLVSHLRNALSPPNVEELREDILKGITTFEVRVLERGILEKQAKNASYAICSLLDETIMYTPWGTQSSFAHYTLLVHFHGETYGGERFFEMLDEMKRVPNSCLDLIEFFWVCLAIGFQGKYRFYNNSKQLEGLYSDTYQLIRRFRGDQYGELSLRWRGLQDLRSPLTKHVPPWVASTVAGVLLLLAFLTFAFMINGISDSVAHDFYALGHEKPIGLPDIPLPELPSKKLGERFKPLLPEEIERNLVEVVDDRILRIHGGFASGSDQLQPDFLPMLKKIGEELIRAGDTVLVTGHTDNKPIFSARFPSNFDLSTARARHVSRLFESLSSTQGKIRYEGRADYESLVPNDSDEHRAMNRRVDILIQ